MAPRVVVSNMVKVKNMVRNNNDTAKTIKYNLLSQNKCIKKNATSKALIEAIARAMVTLNGPKSINDALTVIAVNTINAIPTAR
jgi:hypothetical protein